MSRTIPGKLDTSALAALATLTQPSRPEVICEACWARWSKQQPRTACVYCAHTRHVCQPTPSGKSWRVVPEPCDELLKALRAEGML